MFSPVHLPYQAIRSNPSLLSNISSLPLPHMTPLFHNPIPSILPALSPSLQPNLLRHSSQPYPMLHSAQVFFQLPPPSLIEFHGNVGTGTHPLPVYSSMDGVLYTPILISFYPPETTRVSLFSTYSHNI